MRSKQEWIRATVADIRLVTADTRQIEFALSGRVPRFEPGSHTNIRVRIGGGAATRTYTCLPSPPDRIRVAVKRHAHSRGGSRFMWRLAVGDAIEVTVPENRFELTWRDRPCLLVAGGIGVTPIYGMALAMLGRTAEALVHFERAVRFKADYADAELQWAIGLMLTGRFDAAVPHFERAIELQPAQAHFHHMYGRALAGAGRLAEAVSRLESAVRLDPGKAEMHLDLALALRRLGRVDEATRHYLEANRLNPALAPTH